MNTPTTGYSINQGLVVLTPKQDDAYPIPCTEWNQIRARIENISHEPYAFQTAGALLVGVGLAELASILTGAFNGPDTTRRIVAWAITVVSVLLGAGCFYVASVSRNSHRDRAADIVQQMKFIEARFEPK